MIYIKKIKKVCILALGVLSLTACTKPNNKRVNQDNVFNNETVNTQEIEIDTTESEKAMNIYEKFLAGEIVVGGTAGGIDIDFITIPTGEPDCRYSTKYAILDSNGDNIPDLHIKSARYYYLLTYVDDELRILKNLSPNPQYYALNDEAFISILYGPSGDEYHYFKLDILGNEVGIVNFSKRDTNQNGFFDDADEYSFNEQNVSKEEWDTLTEPYLYTDEEGRECIKNKIEWTVFCEEINYNDLDME